MNQVTFKVCGPSARADTRVGTPQKVKNQINGLLYNANNQVASRQGPTDGVCRDDIPRGTPLSAPDSSGCWRGVGTHGGGQLLLLNLTEGEQLDASGLRGVLVDLSGVGDGLQIPQNHRVVREVATKVLRLIPGQIDLPRLVSRHPDVARNIGL